MSKSKNRKWYDDGYNINQNKFKDRRHKKKEKIKEHEEALPDPGYLKWVPEPDALEE